MNSPQNNQITEADIPQDIQNYSATQQNLATMLNADKEVRKYIKQQKINIETDQNILNLIVQEAQKQGITITNLSNVKDAEGKITRAAYAEAQNEINQFIAQRQKTQQNQQPNNSQTQPPVDNNSASGPENKDNKPNPAPSDAATDKNNTKSGGVSQPPSNKEQAKSNSNIAAINHKVKPNDLNTLKQWISSFLSVTVRRAIAREINDKNKHNDLFKQIKNKLQQNNNKLHTQLLESANVAETLEKRCSYNAYSQLDSGEKLQLCKHICLDEAGLDTSSATDLKTLENILAQQCNAVVSPIINELISNPNKSQSGNKDSQSPEDKEKEERLNQLKTEFTQSIQQPIREMYNVYLKAAIKSKGSEHVDDILKDNNLNDISDDKASASTNISNIIKDSKYNELTELEGSTFKGTKVALAIASAAGIDSKNINNLRTVGDDNVLNSLSNCIEKLTNEKADKLVQEFNAKQASEQKAQPEDNTKGEQPKSDDDSLPSEITVNGGTSSEQSKQEQQALATKTGDVKVDELTDDILNDGSSNSVDKNEPAENTQKKSDQEVSKSITPSTPTEEQAEQDKKALAENTGENETDDALNAIIEQGGADEQPTQPKDNTNEKQEREESGDATKKDETPKTNEPANEENKDNKAKPNPTEQQIDECINELKSLNVWKELTDDYKTGFLQELRDALIKNSRSKYIQNYLQTIALKEDDKDKIISAFKKIGYDVKIRYPKPGDKVDKSWMEVISGHSGTIVNEVMFPYAEVNGTIVKAIVLAKDESN